MTASDARPEAPMAMRDVLRRLREELGDIPPWPAQSPMEYVCGAILVQNTAWTNVQRALEALRRETSFFPDRIAALDDDALGALIRPAGFMRAKSRALRGYARWTLSEAGRAASCLDDVALREALLALPGIGPETADVIALMVFSRRRFIFDAYGRRLLQQAGYAVGSGYEPTRRALEARIEAESLSHAELVEIHGLILQAGKRARAAGGWQVYGPVIGIGAQAEHPEAPRTAGSIAAPGAPSPTA